MFGGIAYFLHRHVRLVLLVAVAAAACGLAGAVGWVTAPV